MSSIECSNAPEDADVGRVDVAVDDEVDPVAGLLSLDVIGHPAEPQEVVGPEARQPVLEVEPLTFAHLLPHAGETGIRDAKIFHHAAHARLQQ